MKSGQVTSFRRTGGSLAGAMIIAVMLSSPSDAVDRIGVRATVLPVTRAGVLGGSNAYDDFTFRTTSGSILFLTAASNFYQSAGRREGETECGDEVGGELTAQSNGSTQTDGDDDAEDHGKQLLCLQVLDGAGSVVCWAERPAQPGWQRDPRLACTMGGAAGAPSTFTLRVSYADQNCGDTSYPPAPTAKDGGPVSTPYLLDGSLHEIASDGPLL